MQRVNNENLAESTAASANQSLDQISICALRYSPNELAQELKKPEHSNASEAEGNRPQLSKEGRALLHRQYQQIKEQSASIDVASLEAYRTVFSEYSNAFSFKKVKAVKEAQTLKPEKVLVKNESPSLEGGALKAAPSKDANQSSALRISTPLSLIGRACSVVEGWASPRKRLLHALKKNAADLEWKITGVQAESHFYPGPAVTLRGFSTIVSVLPKELDPKGKLFSDKELLASENPIDVTFKIGITNNGAINCYLGNNFVLEIPKRYFLLTQAEAIYSPMSSALRTLVEKADKLGREGKLSFDVNAEKTRAKIEAEKSANKASYTLISTALGSNATWASSESAEARESSIKLADLLSEKQAKEFDFDISETVKIIHQDSSLALHCGNVRLFSCSAGSRRRGYFDKDPRSKLLNKLDSRLLEQSKTESAKE